jgi:mono/diheme cytochrome c family protein
MKKGQWLMPVVVGCVLFFSACSKNDYGSGDLYVPTASDATSTATLDELQQGRELYQNNCNSCHYLYSPDDYSATRWRSIMSQMAPNTRMSSSEVTLVTKYVTRGK